ncbi:MAG: MFS transporter [Burkholderiaceae bacterium]|jgi:ATP-dependent protease HslVU (ClpYQ) peptidase subunit|nr:MFS transporter [Burkholderiaceae bacterium]
MTTIVVVKKDREIAIASDALVTFGETRLPHGYEVNEKIFQVGDSYIGLAGSTAHFAVLADALRGMGEDCRLASRVQVFGTFQKLHQILKEKYFLNTKEDDADPYESSQITAVIANPAGIFGVYSYREVFSFDRFWGIGSGRNFALGAMYAAYERSGSARRIAELGVKAGCEFDKSSALPVRVFSLSAVPPTGEPPQQVQQGPSE